MSDQDRLVILSPPRHHGGHGGDAEASAPIAKEIGQTGCFVVFIFYELYYVTIFQRPPWEPQIRAALWLLCITVGGNVVDPCGF